MNLNLNQNNHHLTTLYIIYNPPHTEIAIQKSKVANSLIYPLYCYVCSHDKFYKENEWRIDSVKKYSGEYTVIDAVQVRGGRDSRTRAYGGAIRGGSKEFGLHG